MITLSTSKLFGYVTMYMNSDLEVNQVIGYPYRQVISVTCIVLNCYVSYSQCILVLPQYIDVVI